MLIISHITTTHPPLASMIGSGGYTATRDKKGIMVQRGIMNSALITLMFHSDSEIYLASTGLDYMSGDALSEALLNDPNLYADWAKELKELIRIGCLAECSSKTIIAKPLYMLPIGHTWTHALGLTMIGDAAHLMTPFAGEGVNLAMLDALELSRAIVTASEQGLEILDSRIKDAEERMWERTQPFSQESWDNLHMIFADDAPDGFVKFMMSHMPPPDDQ